MYHDDREKRNVGRETRKFEGKVLEKKRNKNKKELRWWERNSKSGGRKRGERKSSKWEWIKRKGKGKKKGGEENYKTRAMLKIKYERVRRNSNGSRTKWEWKKKKRSNEWKENRDLHSPVANTGTEIWENVQEKGIIRVRDGRRIRRVKCEDYTARAITLMGRARKLVSISFSKGRE